LKDTTTWSTPPVHFALVILEVGSCELFAQTVLQLFLLISAFHGARITSVSH
jgi:hypothetical protein